MQIFLKDLEDVKLLLACVDGGSARLKFWRRSRNPKKGGGDEAFESRGLRSLPRRRF